MDHREHWKIAERCHPEVAQELSGNGILFSRRLPSLKMTVREDNRQDETILFSQSKYEPAIVTSPEMISGQFLLLLPGHSQVYRRTG